MLSASSANSSSSAFALQPGPALDLFAHPGDVLVGQGGGLVRGDTGRRQWDRRCSAGYPSRLSRIRTTATTPSSTWRSGRPEVRQQGTGLFSHGLPHCPPHGTRPPRRGPDAARGMDVHDKQQALGGAHRPARTWRHGAGLLSPGTCSTNGRVAAQRRNDAAPARRARCSPSRHSRGAAVDGCSRWTAPPVSRSSPRRPVSKRVQLLRGMARPRRCRCSFVRPGRPHRRTPAPALRHVSM